MARKKSRKKATKKRATTKKRKVAKKGGRKKKAVKRKTKKRATKKRATKKRVTKKAAKKKKKSKRKPNPAFMRPLMPVGPLADVIGSKAMPRTEVMKKIWVYIKKHKLQDQKNRRNINGDDKLRKLFGKKTVSMFELTKIISKYLKN